MNEQERRLLALAYAIISTLPPSTQKIRQFKDGYEEWARQYEQERRQLNLWNGKPDPWK